MCIRSPSPSAWLLHSPHLQFFYSYAHHRYEYLVSINLDFNSKECEELEADERNIEMKIIKKQEELERSEKRFKSLENVRPQFMDEVRKFHYAFYDIIHYHN